MNDGQDRLSRSRLIPASTVAAIRDRFVGEVPEIFGSNFVFGFIFGGVAKGYADLDHDIDTFICVHRTDRSAEQIFRRWYFDLHNDFEMKADESDSGEVMTLYNLSQRVNYVLNTPFRLTIDSYFEYEAIVWVDILADQKIGVAGDLLRLKHFEKLCGPMPAVWRSTILDSLENPSQFADMPISLLCERFVDYQKRPGISFDRNANVIGDHVAESSVVTIKPLFSELSFGPESNILRAESTSGRTKLTVGSNLDDLVEIFERANNTTDASELARLFLGRVEARLPKNMQVRREDLNFWNESRRQRTCHWKDISCTRALPMLIKTLFNNYFQNDLYGEFRSDANIILSSGSLSTNVIRLCSGLKDTLRFALDKGWHGYSDSRGREATRIAFADLENLKIGDTKLSLDNIALTMGGTSAVSLIAETVRSVSGSTIGTAICAMPNYPPLVEAMARHFPTKLVPIVNEECEIEIESLIGSIDASTGIVFLQTVLNPNGKLFSESQLERILHALPQTGFLVLDECHEHYGQLYSNLFARSDPRVIRFNSLSKLFAIAGMKIGWITASKQFIEALYETASTSYGSPPSFFYLFAEIFARFEANYRNESEWNVSSIHKTLDRSYQVNQFDLQRALTAYREQRIENQVRVDQAMSICKESLEARGIQYLSPDHSINILGRFFSAEDSYAGFRQLLQASSVSVFPALLCYAPFNNLGRLSPCIEDHVLEAGLMRISQHL